MFSRANLLLCLLISACAKGDPVADSRPGTGVPTSGIPDGPPTGPPTSSSTTAVATTEVETSSPGPTTGPSHNTSGMGPKFDLATPPIPTGGPETGRPETTGLVDPGEPGETSTSSSTGGMEDSSSTGDRPDLQPNEGLYEPCLSTEECDPVLTDGCFLVTSEDMQIEDGYCTLLCGDVVECGEAPMVGGMQVCAMVLDAKICAILCMTNDDCPQGMLCKNLFGGKTYCI